MEEAPLAQSRINIVRIAAWLFALGFMIVCLEYFSSFLQPIILAVMVWYLIFVLRDYTRKKIRIKGKQLPEWLLSILAFVLIILITFGIAEMVIVNLELIIARSPVYIQNSKELIDNIRAVEEFEFVQERILERIEEIDIRPLLTGLLNGLSGFASNIFMIIIYVAFLLAEEKLFNKKMDIISAEAGKSNGIKNMLQEVNDSIRTYVMVKTQMSFLTGFLSYIILLLFGVDFPVLWAFLIFLLNYIPYIGSFVATFLPSIFVVFQFEAWEMFLWVFISIQVVQLAVGNIIEPRVMGKTLNLSPLGVIIALTFWGVIWGILGMIISVPITSIMVIVASRFPSVRFLAIWLSETGEIHK